MRDDLAQAMSAISAETPLRYLDEPLTQISHLLADDPVADDLVAEARRHIAARAEEEARANVSRLRIYLSETYRLHRRMVRNRRSTAVKRGFPARGRELAHPWLIPDPDERRQDLFGAFDDLRLGLEQEDLATAGNILQIVLGRILAPMTALEDLARALRGQPGHDLSAEELAAVNELARTDAGREFAGDLEQILAMTTGPDRLSAAASWARQRVGSRKCAIACTFPRTARLTAELLTRELGAHRVSALLEDQGEDERFRRTTEFEQSTERKILVLDRSAEEGANLQFIEEVLHLNVPVFTTHLEQRLGRFDRWSELDAPGALGDLPGSFPARPRAHRRLDDDAQRRVRRVHVLYLDPAVHPGRPRARVLPHRGHRDPGRREEADAGPGRGAGDRAAPDSRPGPSRQHRRPGRRRRPGEATRPRSTARSG